MGAAALVVVAAASMSGCGASGSGVSAAGALEVVRAAPDRTIAAGTARFRAAAGPSSLEGVVDLVSGRAQARLRTPETGDGAGLPVELDYARAYVDGLPPAPAAGVAPPWLLGPGAQPGNPLTALDLLRGAVEAEPYGGTALYSVPTFRYQITVDRAAAVVALGERRGPAVIAATTGTGQLPADVWLDAEGRVRRVQFGNDLAVATTTTDRRGFPVATTVDLFDFGLAAGAAGANENNAGSGAGAAGGDRP